METCPADRRRREWQKNIAICFLVFVAVAGAFGAVTASKKTIYVQLLPELIAILAVVVT